MSQVEVIQRFICTGTSLKSAQRDVKVPSLRESTSVALAFEAAWVKIPEDTESYYEHQSFLWPGADRDAAGSDCVTVLTCSARQPGDSVLRRCLRRRLARNCCSDRSGASRSSTVSPDSLAQERFPNGGSGGTAYPSHEQTRAPIANPGAISSLGSR